MLDQLTNRQAEIYRWIRERIITDRCPPSYREIGAAFGIRSPNGVKCHLQALVLKGLLRIAPGARAVRLVEDPPLAAPAQLAPILRTFDRIRPDDLDFAGFSSR